MTEWATLSSFTRGAPLPVSQYRIWLRVKRGQKNISSMNPLPGGFAYERMSWDRVCSTVTAQARTIWHPDEPRTFSPYELCRFQTFPDDYEVASQEDARYLMGMSVPPLMTYTVASAIREQWLGGVRMQRVSVPWTLAKDLPVIGDDAPTVMSTFACGGGSSMGYKLAGFRVVAANDIDPRVAVHYKRNLNPPLFYECPIGDVVKMARARELPEHLYNLDVLDGSPPCSTFSTSGSREKSWGKEKKFREGQTSQVLSDLFFDYLDLVEALKPRVSVAENVKGMLVGNAKGYTRLVVERYREIGYRVQVFLLNAADCGVPQRRERVFFVALRDDLPGGKIVVDPHEQWVTVRQALAGLPTSEENMGSLALTDHMRYWYERTPPGQTFADAVKSLGLPEALWDWRRNAFDSPAHTLTATACALHPDEPRRFSFGERARLQSFPDDYDVDGDFKQGSYMVGMSVPPLMTETVASAIRACWLAG